MSTFVDVNPFSLVPLAPGVPPIPRAPADTQAGDLLQQAVNSGQLPDTLTQMLNGDVPSMLNGLDQIPLSELLNAVIAPGALSADDGSIGSIAAPPQWGVFDSFGQVAILADTVVAFEYRKEYRVSDYPLEEGAFQSYNKVATPYELKVTLARGGTDDDRTNFFDQIDSVQASTDLFSVVTPERVYSQANLTHVDFPRRADKGFVLISAELWFEEIRESGTATFTQTKIPAGQDTQNDGNVQPVTPSPSQAAAIDNPPPEGG